MKRLRHDGNHWYLVPKEKLARFDFFDEELSTKQYMDDPELFDIFIEEFNQYRIDSPFEVDCD